MSYALVIGCVIPIMRIWIDYETCIDDNTNDVMK